MTGMRLVTVIIDWILTILDVTCLGTLIYAAVTKKNQLVKRSAIVMVVLIILTIIEFNIAMKF